MPDTGCNVYTRIRDGEAQYREFILTHKRKIYTFWLQVYSCVTWHKNPKCSQKSAATSKSATSYLNYFALLRTWSLVTEAAMFERGSSVKSSQFSEVTHTVSCSKVETKSGRNTSVKANNFLKFHSQQNFHSRNHLGFSSEVQAMDKVLGGVWGSHLLFYSSTPPLSPAAWPRPGRGWSQAVGTEYRFPTTGATHDLLTSRLKPSTAGTGCGNLNCWPSIWPNEHLFTIANQPQMNMLFPEWKKSV